ncbi:hypothetical protein CONLIGDRAFT_291853 [Coniochaeta ligniaria NRRL 30616]|uniref:RRM domain-containing protein n=1 Tax=Coniochaeta ligniaria NRRL 30616 TaxID=1408157 RepID=A0A1J7JC07_9PEZI|nr:hypothetical protein CONLIGDRAFT_291853 [Coniochaeta ligniaria NRRL 30616]
MALSCLARPFVSSRGPVDEVSRHAMSGDATARHIKYTPRPRGPSERWRSHSVDLPRPIAFEPLVGRQRAYSASAVEFSHHGAFVEEPGNDLEKGDTAPGSCHNEGLYGPMVSYHDCACHRCRIASRSVYVTGVRLSDAKRGRVANMLRTHFRQYGRVENVNMLQVPRGKNPRFSAKVRFRHPHSATAAVEATREVDLAVSMEGAAAWGAAQDAQNSGGEGAFTTPLLGKLSVSYPYFSRFRAAISTDKKGVVESFRTADAGHSVSPSTHRAEEARREYARMAEAREAWLRDGEARHAETRQDLERPTKSPSSQPATGSQQEAKTASSATTSILPSQGKFKAPGCRFVEVQRQDKEWNDGRKPGDLAEVRRQDKEWNDGRKPGDLAALKQVKLHSQHLPQLGGANGVNRYNDPHAEFFNSTHTQQGGPVKNGVEVAQAEGTLAPPRVVRKKPKEASRRLPSFWLNGDAKERQGMPDATTTRQLSSAMWLSPGPVVPARRKLPSLIDMKLTC